MAIPSTKLKLGTRGSLLARTQSRLVAGELEKLHPGLEVELVIIKTSGDVIQDRPLYEAGGKGLFVKELELALLNGEVDFAVHSYKDVPVTMPLVEQSGLVIAATPGREDPRDVLATRVGAHSAPPRLVELPQGAVVGTGSLRRKCQVLAKRSDLTVQPIRGNIDTRLRRLDEGDYDAVILAMAGVRRAGLFDDSRMHVMEADEMLPAPGQGALALQCRAGDERTKEFLQSLHDVHAQTCVDAERALVMKLNGDCHSPIAALATLEGERFTLRAAVGARDGGAPVVYADVSGFPKEISGLVDRCYQGLYDQGATGLLQAGR